MDKKIKSRMRTAPGLLSYVKEIPAQGGDDSI